MDFAKMNRVTFEFSNGIKVIGEPENQKVCLSVEITREENVESLLGRKVNFCADCFPHMVRYLGCISEKLDMEKAKEEVCFYIGSYDDAHSFTLDDLMTEDSSAHEHGTN